MKIKLLTLAVLVSLVGCASPLAPKRIDALLQPEEDLFQAPMSTVANSSGSIYTNENKNFLIGTGSSYRLGDIIVVSMDEAIQANDSTANKSSKVSNNKTGFGFNGSLMDTKLPSADLNLDFKNGTNYNGSGASSQSHSLKGNISVTVVKVYPNGNLAIAGKKTIGLKNGIETIAIAGVIREADISTTDNTIPSNKIANARIYYIGEGDNYDRSQSGFLTDAVSSKYWMF
ncbi:flagellar basal body L-ring protein FlgH [Photobacterium kishitanii]|uniref:flagellar basal body L-ring protein FlgH n=1 Tax=Photobacterium kishitanii TaxID=318456 RepID=UPI00043523AD|nr:flagellar basal body L-ring protein FlgH [Photobacterium kishitanii]PSU85701.1 flagellar basal body L-ring protein FlgH [Photobacterium kishitanii]PSU94277.1 flagellar basal body L-ring protein FlgH [Photobacterium kishitanii]PSV19606.1 flagellar basal body L-ring protein FlgH [Photobacterium kishitanii]CEO42185.1 putative Flagellar L-ring protein FlgH2, on the plasmid [Photobacterium kishitanii]